MVFLKPVVTRYQGKSQASFFAGRRGFAMPEVYEFLEAERIKYAIRCRPTKFAEQDRLLAQASRSGDSDEVRPVPMPISPIRREAGPSAPGDRQGRVASGRALSPRRVQIVTNLSRPAERVVAFYNKRGTCEQWIKEGKGAIKWDAVVVQNVRS